MFNIGNYLHALQRRIISCALMLHKILHQLLRHQLSNRMRLSQLKCKIANVRCCSKQQRKANRSTTSWLLGHYTTRDVEEFGRIESYFGRFLPSCSLAYVMKPLCTGSPRSAPGLRSASRHTLSASVTQCQLQKS